MLNKSMTFCYIRYVVAWQSHTVDLMISKYIGICILFTVGSNVFAYSIQLMPEITTRAIARAHLLAI